MRLSESKRAKSTGETTRKLLESDYLLGVNDEARQGALRFSLEDGGPYLTPKHKKSIPPLMDLPRLLSATERCLDYDETAEDLKNITGTWLIHWWRKTKSIRSRQRRPPCYRQVPEKR